MEVDGIAALRPWPIRVQLGGELFRIPPHPATTWVIPIVGDDWLAIVPGLVESDDVDELITGGQVSGDELIRAAWSAVAAAAGVPWIAAARLVVHAATQGAVSGLMLLDPDRVSLGAWVQRVYALLVADREQKDISRLDHSLLVMPPELAGLGEDGDESGFEAMARGRGIRL